LFSDYTKWERYKKRCQVPDGHIPDQRIGGCYVQRAVLCNSKANCEVSDDASNRNYAFNGKSNDSQPGWLHDYVHCLSRLSRISSFSDSGVVEGHRGIGQTARVTE